jgi:hypothetical protein
MRRFRERAREWAVAAEEAAAEDTGEGEEPVAEDVGEDACAEQRAVYDPVDRR